MSNIPDSALVQYFRTLLALENEATLALLALGVDATGVVSGVDLCAEEYLFEKRDDVIRVLLEQYRLPLLSAIHSLMDRHLHDETLRSLIVDILSSEGTDNKSLYIGILSDGVPDDFIPNDLDLMFDKPNDEGFRKPKPEFRQVLIDTAPEWLDI